MAGVPAAEGDAKGYRHYWELTVLLGLRDALRSGDVFVPGSRRYADPASYLMTPAQWETQRLEFCHLVGKPADPAKALAAAEAELHVALADLEEVLASGAGPVRWHQARRRRPPPAAQRWPARDTGDRRHRARPWPERLEWEHGADRLRWPGLYDEVPDQDLADEHEE